MAVIGNVHISECLPRDGCSIPDCSGKGSVHLTAGFLGFLQLICHVPYSWAFLRLCAAYDHPPYGCCHGV